MFMDIEPIVMKEYHHKKDTRDSEKVLSSCTINLHYVL
jgi:hypothetical protein